MTTWDIVQGFLIALFCGSLIGMERERGKRAMLREAADTGRTPATHPAGLRTHIMVVIFAAILRLLDVTLAGDHAFPLAGLVITSLLAATAYGIRAVKTPHYGVTTMFTLVSTYGLGVLSLTELRIAAAGAAVVIAAVLAAKKPLHRFADALTQDEIAAAIKLGLISAVLLPLVPNRDLGPEEWPWLAERLQNLGVTPEQMASLEIVNPFTIWLLVVLISGVGFAGYILMRSLGAEKGLLLTGLVGGLVSSTAVSLSMAERSRQSPGLKNPIVSAVLAACAVMSGRVVVIVASLAPGLIAGVLPPMLAMGGSAIAIAWLLTRKGDGASDGGAEALHLSTPFALAPALKLAAIFLVVRVLAGVTTVFFGGAGLLVTAALSGVVDVDAITVSVSQEVGSGRAPSPALAAGAIFLAVSVNTVVKGCLVLFGGSKVAGRATFAWLMATLALGGAGLAVSLLVF
jgi:uncharacterized membrane protein (DUF4010 family)